jgi:hypothetical protein
MNMNWKFLVAKNNSRIIFGIDSAFARSCFAAVLMAAVLFAAPVAARKRANPSEPIVFFPQRPLPVSKDDAYKSMLALARGRLELKNGCLRLKELPGTGIAILEEALDQRSTQIQNIF